MVLKKGSDKYTPIDWNDAIQLVSDNINAAMIQTNQYFYTSGRTSNEAAFLYQLFARTLGTNNMPDCSNMCHESSGEV